MMPPKREKSTSKPRSVRKCGTGITGLDEITYGGLPANRTTLICGGAGCGKTLMALEFIVRGITEFDEPGLYVSFEESPNDLIENFSSLGVDLRDLIDQGKLVLDHIQLNPIQTEEEGEYDLEGLFVRLNESIQSIGAKRVAIDTIEALFSAFKNESILRAELKRLFDWLKAQKVTSVVTGEKGQGALTRHCLEEYVSDCVIYLDHRVDESLTTRRLRIVKYRGSLHGTNEYPFLIDLTGITVLPITSVGLTHEVTNERVSSGIKKLDEMLGGQGFYRGSSILFSGLAGTGKTTFAAHFAAETCRRGKKNLSFGFEESQSQFIRNMRAVGLDFQSFVKKGLFRFEASRPTLHGLESHLVTMYREIDLIQPDTVTVDPISTFLGAGSTRDIKSMLMRLIDFLKSRHITALFTSLIHNEQQLESTDVGVSSLMDTWILLRTIEMNGERNRGINVLKSRGMNHSNQVREFRLSENGIDLIDVYVGPMGILTGSARTMQEAKDRAVAKSLIRDRDQKRFYLDRKKKALEAQIALLQAEFIAETKDVERELQSEEMKSIAESELRQESALGRTHVSTTSRRSH